MNDVSRVVIGDPDGEHISVGVSRRTGVGSGEYYEDNWLATRIEVRVAGFRADYPADLMTSDLVSLRDMLGRLSGLRRSARRPGRETWQPMEPWLTLRFDMGPDIGSVSGIANHRIDDGNSLSFSMRVGWPALDTALDELDVLLIEFPVIGSP